MGCAWPAFGMELGMTACTASNQAKLCPQRHTCELHRRYLEASGREVLAIVSMPRSASDGCYMYEPAGIREAVRISDGRETMSNEVPQYVLSWFLEQMKCASSAGAKKPYNCVVSNIEKAVFKKVIEEIGSEVEASKVCGVSRQRLRYCIGKVVSGPQRTPENYSLPTEKQQ